MNFALMLFFYKGHTPSFDHDRSLAVQDLCLRYGGYRSLLYHYNIFSHICQSNFDRNSLIDPSAVQRGTQQENSLLQKRFKCGILTVT